MDVYVLGRRHFLEQLAQTIVWERDIRQAATEKNDLQSGSSSWCTKCFSSQVVPSAASWRRLIHYSFCLSNPIKNGDTVISNGNNRYKL
jgi:hypothetical protein